MLNVEELGFEGLVEQLRKFESQYGMLSPEFYKKFMAHEFNHDGDDELIFWAGLYELYLRLAPRYAKSDSIFTPAE